VVAPVASGRGGGIPVGLHHVTAICANLNRTTAFYTEVLGLRLVKRTVNYDDPATEHFYFGDAVGSPGSVLSFFEWSHLAPDQVGLGTAHHVVLTVPDDGAQRRWIARLRRFCVATAGPKDRTYCRSVYFQDPDGLILELATRGPGFAVDEAEDRLGVRIISAPDDERARRTSGDTAADDVLNTQIDEDIALPGLNHVTLFGRDMDQTAAFYRDAVGLHVVKPTFNYDDVDAKHWYFGDGRGTPGTVVTAFEVPRMRSARIGPGTVHHFAFLLDSATDINHARARLQRAGVATTPPLDRKYFRSVARMGRSWSSRRAGPASSSMSPRARSEPG